MIDHGGASVRLDGGDTTLILGVRDEAFVMYWGAALSSAASTDGLAALAARDIPPAAAAVEPRISLTPVMARAFTGAPGLAGHRAGLDWAPAPVVVGVEPGCGPASVRIVARDEHCALSLTHAIALDPATGVFSASTTLTNDGSTDYWLERLAAPVVPLPHWAQHLVGFSGRWADEFRTERQPIGPGAYVRENRRGRTSHDCPPQVIVAETAACEAMGRVAGFHLGASGNHMLRIERLADGRAYLAMGELLLPGEVRLTPGASYTTPTLYAATCANGFNGLSQRLHDFVRRMIVPPELKRRPRPVHYNSWEAVYFDHRPQSLRDLADRAAALGIERFVLDDGWFGGRRNDRAGLGDWVVSRDVYPDGLGPLIKHVRSLGMEFGLWVEPEMVNPDSDLYRRHPDWVLALPGVAQIEARHQFVLDLTRREVADHLFAAMNALLADHDIAYLKWDMNRDINHPGSGGTAVAARQALAVHALIDRLHAAHPHIEIESCASGGGRANYEILKRTHRVWTSDSNDALDRLQIQRGFSYFYPAEVMGAHVGPRTCHITGRVLPMQLRAAVALFGHMGVEMDLREIDESEAATLAAAIALHKRHRDLLHSGRLVRLDMPLSMLGLGVVAEDRSQALFLYALVEGHTTTLPGRYHFDGLDPARDYRLELVWAPDRVSMAAAGPDVGHCRGDVLMAHGVELPLMRPQSALIFKLTAA
jgi:alpha-galactosidase